MHLDQLGDAELIAALPRLALSERSATANLVAHLIVFEARSLHFKLGHASLFAYCREVLHLSEHEAYNRIEAARAARRHSRILDLLREGLLTLTAIRLLAPVLNEDNRDRLLGAAAHCTKRQIEELVARERPRADVPDRVRRVPVTPLASRAKPTCLPSTDILRIGDSSPGHAPAAPPPHRSVESPLAPDRYEIRFTAGASTCEKLRLARDLLRHAVPGGETVEIVDRALTVLLESLMRKKFASSARPRVSRGPSADARPVAAGVKRTVYARDGGRCAFVGSDGRRCATRAWLEFHHVKPWAASGGGTIENVELRCRAHNQYEATLYFGPIVEARRQAHETGAPGG